ncbi:MAG: MFS transporter [Burkholderiales bacterium]
MGSTLSPRVLAAYAALAFPLAMAAVPVYVHVPRFYAAAGTLTLTTLGVILLATRLIDAVLDPWLGRWSDRSAQSGSGRQGFIVAAVLCLGAGMVALFHPPGGSTAALALWLAGSLLLTHLGFSLGTISYFAWGAALSVRYHERTRVTAARSAVGVAGVLAATALPDLLAPTGSETGLPRFSLLYVPILIAAAAVTLFGVTTRDATSPTAVSATGRPLFAPLGNVRFRWLLAVFVASGVASAIPATLLLFYVQDVLGRADLSGGFLGLYCLFGACGMPLWVRASRRLGKKGAWGAGMATSVAAFLWAFALGPGDVLAFGLVCALSGIAYGAELALPPSLLADVVDADAAVARGRPDGAYFGFWQLTEKLNLALAAGIALPLLGWAGYESGQTQPRMGDLSAMYALVPCLLKTVAVGLLWRAPVDDAARPEVSA